MTAVRKNILLETNYFNDNNVLDKVVVKSICNMQDEINIPVTERTVYCAAESHFNTTV